MELQVSQAARRECNLPYPEYSEQMTSKSDLNLADMPSVRSLSSTCSDGEGEDMDMVSFPGMTLPYPPNVNIDVAVKVNNTPIMISDVARHRQEEKQDRGGELPCTGANLSMPASAPHLQGTMPAANGACSTPGGFHAP